MMPQNLIPVLSEAAKAILNVYESPQHQISFKEDKSPLTAADKASHHILTHYLNAEFPDMPILSEEGQQTDYVHRKHWERYWLLDPLDGTKEFIKRTGHFCINLSLMQGQHPEVAWIYVPLEHCCYWAVKGGGAFKTTQNSTIRLQVRSHELMPKPRIVVLSSASHASPEEAQWYAPYDIERIEKMGSAIKFGLLAEGKGDFYVRFRPTMEWDTAAGQLIVEEAGGQLLSLKGKPFIYNRPELYNGGFVCKAIFY